MQKSSKLSCLFHIDNTTLILNMSKLEDEYLYDIYFGIYYSL